MKTHIDIKKFFFDKSIVVKMVDKATRDVFSRFGAFVQRRAKSSIRQRRRPSAPGSPPSSHTGVLKDFIYFGYDPEDKTVVIGPTPTNQVFFDNDRKPVTGTVPGVLEDGGSITVKEVFMYGSWRRMDLRSRRRAQGLPTRFRKIDIKARPFMKPAFEIEKKQLPKMWQDVIVKGHG